MERLCIFIISFVLVICNLFSTVSSVSLHIQKIYQPNQDTPRTSVSFVSIDAEGASTNNQTVFLQSRTGFFLQIPRRGKITGTLNRSSKFVDVHMQSLGPSVVRFLGVYSKSYLAMNSEGVLYTTRRPTDECLFKEKLEYNSFHTFCSYKYSGLNSANGSREWYLAIKRNGKIKHGVNTSKRQRAVQFVVLPVRLSSSLGLS
ncbi:fibroblast growth factor 1 [Nematostella vectensis]|uniref:fibroblast growth factor 1 n=1 Tax=Nematostella vectensis TaxID=45351 RepID=UPI0013901139|nr:fibroblast growth factor 1 [Nematostella vectensis]